MLAGKSFDVVVVVVVIVVVVVDNDDDVAVVILLLGSLSKTAEYGDGNIGKTIKLITQDKRRT